METFFFVGMCRFSAALLPNLQKLGDDEGKLDSAKQIERKMKFIELIRFQNDSKS